MIFLPILDGFKNFRENSSGAGATFDWTFFDNSKLINFDD
jgi:hypothetical protein